MQPVSLEDFLLIAEGVLGQPAHELQRSMSIARAESALRAPFASYEGIELYTSLHEKAAVLGSGIVRGHPLRDGNKRVALLCVIELVERNGRRWTLPAGGQDEVAATIERLMVGQLSEREFAAWVQARVGPEA